MQFSDTEAEQEEMRPIAADEFRDVEEPEVPPSVRPKLRAEAVLGILTLLCVALLVSVLLISLPYFSGASTQNALEQDPDAVLRPSHQIEEQELKEDPILEETEAPEETTEPTIPPELNPYNRFDFQYNRNNYLICQRQESYPGIDVSAFQRTIDWQKVADSGIVFAMVRLGYRGYGAAGKMVEDEYVKQNLQGARDAGLYVGAYFFSQATSIKEVDEEIEFMLKILGDFELNMPIVLDWEVPGVENPRTKYVDRRTLTDMQIHFCQVMTEKGYQPMVYFNWGQSSRMLHLNELEDYPFWLALYQDRMTYPYRVEMWQYTSCGRVPGIEGDVDIDIYMPDLRPKA